MRAARERTQALGVEKSLAEKPQEKEMDNLPEAPDENRPTESKESPLTQRW